MTEFPDNPSEERTKLWMYIIDRGLVIAVLYGVYLLFINVGRDWVDTQQELIHGLVTSEEQSKREMAEFMKAQQTRNELTRELVEEFKLQRQ